MKLREDLKGWQIARVLFGKNTQAECKIVKKLRKGKLEVIEDYGEGCYLVKEEKDELGWIMFDEVLSL